MLAKGNGDKEIEDNSYYMVIIIINGIIPRSWNKMEVIRIAWYICAIRFEQCDHIYTCYDIICEK